MKTIVLFICSLIFASSVNAQWTRTNGPEGVAVRSLANINGAIYAGTEVNGVYASTDDGLTWVARNSGIETYGISSIISYQGYIFVGTFGAGVYRSSDGGQTWLPPSNGGNLFVESIAADGPYIFACTISDGVQRSSDNGATWTEKLGGYFGFFAMCISGTKVFVSASNYTFVTTDYGETWSDVPQLSGASVFSYYSIGDTIFVGARNEIYRSTDNGNSFTNINIYFTSTIVNLYSITSTGSTVFIATSYDGVYKSTDFGNTWFAANEGMGPKDVRAVTITDASSLVAGSHYVGMYRSTDYGVSWNKSQTGFPAGTSILSLLESESSIYAGTRDGVYRTDDNGDSWMKLTGQSDTVNYCSVWDMCELDGDLYISAFLQFNTTVYKTTDKGITWIRCDNGLPPDNPFIKGLVSSGENVIAGTDDGIYYTSDKGLSWHPTNAPTEYIESMAASGDYVYAVVTFYGIYRSLNNGVSWIPSLPSTIDYVDVAAIDNYAFAGSFFEGAKYSTNYGSGWYASNGFPPDASIFVIGPAGNGMVLAGTDLEPSWIYVSFDNGNYYSPYSEGLFENASVEAFATNETFSFAGTDYNGVWRRYLPGVPVELISFTATTDENTVTLSWTTSTETSNSGFEVQRKNIDWERIGFIEGHGTTTEENSYLFVDNNLTAGKYQYRLKQLDYDGSFKFSDIVEIEVLSPIEFSLSQNYPNPFNPTTTIQYSIPQSGTVKLAVYNTLGEVVRILANNYKDAGTYTINFNASNLSSGIYYYRLEAGAFIETKKMVIMK